MEKDYTLVRDKVAYHSLVIQKYAEMATSASYAQRWLDILVFLASIREHAEEARALVPHAMFDDTVPPTK